MNNFCTYCTYSIKLQIKWIFNKVIKNNIAQTLTQLIQYILFIKKKKKTGLKLSRLKFLIDCYL